MEDTNVKKNFLIAFQKCKFELFTEIEFYTVRGKL